MPKLAIVVVLAEINAITACYLSGAAVAYWLVEVLAGSKLVLSRKQNEMLCAWVPAWLLHAWPSLE